ncbi:Purine nucleoside phosphorylase [Fulvivirga imtechensis AK7]|uniref:Uridine phosphorylase n=1 Tax=Fulvivirga imtechensis AK7 TaxID=1237149 RepID=L8JWI7_9BACT|nr:purine-nucleoside phosphorylase [Fulvivirga imtechensis]ELR73411.1 Purine nucleoside phosphorylase [Fulvivirga imtechensis AK7]
MSLHIGAEPGEIAETVLLSGDPLRAKFIAENLLEDAVCYNTVRNMLGFTGYHHGKRVSVQGSGMGQPSLAIYVHELLQSYKVKNLVRIGTCGALLPDIRLGEIIIAQGACTDSNASRLQFNGLDFAPLADFNMLLKAYESAGKEGIKVRIGNVFSTDLFYFKNDPERWKVWSEHGVLCVDMETSALYTMAAAANARALSILTVSDNIITGSFSTSKDREQSLIDMVRIALGELDLVNA